MYFIEEDSNESIRGTHMAIFLIVLYLLSPILLLILFLVTRASLSRVKREKQELDNYHRHVEEQYRQYVCQLQNQIRSMDPQAKPEPTVQSGNAPVQQNPSAPQPSYTNTFPTSTAFPQPMATPRPSAPIQTQKSAPIVNQTNHSSTMILVFGVIFLMLASIGFISATWSALSAGVRAFSLLSFSAIFLGAGVFAKKKLQLPKTSISFYSIGSAALPITIFGAGAYHLLGSSFALRIPTVYHTCLLAFASLTLLLAFGTFFFRNRGFAVGTLISISATVFSLALRIHHSTSMGILLISIFASAVILLEPVVNKISDESPLLLFKKVYLPYAIVNLYIMTVIALFMSQTGIWSGIVLLLLAATFIFASALRQDTGLFSLPSVLLILIGLAQIIQLTSQLSATIWLIAAGLTFLALSLLPNTKEKFSTSLLVCGLAAIVLSTILTLNYTLHYNNWAFLALTLIPVITLVSFSIRQKHPFIFVGALLPLFTFFLGLSLHVIDLTGYAALDTVGFFSRFSNSQVGLTALIVSGVLYFLFSFLPNQKLYTQTGNLLLFAIMAISGFNYMVDLSFSYMPVTVLLSIFFLALCLIQANRRDLWNVFLEETDDLHSLPTSVVINRCIYASVWPLFFIPPFSHIYTSLLTMKADTIGYAVSALFCFVYAVFRFGRDRVHSATRPQIISKWVSLITASIMILYTIFSWNCRADQSQIIYVIQHLTPILIPLFFLSLLLLNRGKKTPSAESSSFLNHPMIFTLLALFSLTMILPYLLDIQNVLEHELTYLNPTIVLLVMTTCALLYLLVMKLRLKETSPLHFEEATHRFPLRTALFIWTTVIGLYLLVVTLSTPSSETYLFQIFMLMLVMGINVYLFHDQHIVPTILCALSESALLISLIDDRLGWASGFPAWAVVLLLQLPTLLLCLPLFVQSEHTTKRMSIFWSAFSTQLLAFLTTPILTQDASLDLDECAYHFYRHTHTSSTIETFFQDTHLSITTNRYLFIALLGFILIEILVILRPKNKISSLRAYCLLFVTVTSLVWMKLITLPSLCDLVEAVYLLPLAVLTFCIPWIFRKNNAGDASSQELYRLRFIFFCIEMGMLAIISLLVNDTFSLILFGIIGILILLIGYGCDSRNTLYLGATSIAGMILHIIHLICGSMSWWIYLFITGTILITIAVRNEIRKRNS